MLLLLRLYSRGVTREELIRIRPGQREAEFLEEAGFREERLFVGGKEWREEQVRPRAGVAGFGAKQFAEAKVRPLARVWVPAGMIGWVEKPKVVKVVELSRGAIGKALQVMQRLAVVWRDTQDIRSRNLDWYFWRDWERRQALKDFLEKKFPLFLFRPCCFRGKQRIRNVIVWWVFYVRKNCLSRNSSFNSMSVGRP